MRRSHFAAFAPHCPRCARAGAGRHPLHLAVVLAERADDVRAGILQCSNPDCVLEFPIIDAIPVIVPDPRALLAERAVELLVRDDLDPMLQGLLGDAIGPGSWFDVLRQTLSTYGWDGWADLDPAEPAAGAASEAAAPVPGAARRCLARLAVLARAAPAGEAAGGEAAGGEAAGGDGAVRRVLDLGCGAGRTSFDLAAAHPGALVLGIDLSPGLLRLARGALDGRVAYPRRRIGLVYDQRAFPVAPAGAERVDFWACDAQALPFAPATADLVVALNLLDCVPEPRRLLAGLAEAVRPGGGVWLACPYDWSTRATPLETWIGGHSQRAPHAGAAEPFLHTLLTAGAHPQSVVGLAVRAEVLAWPWQTRLHDRGSVLYRTHLLALRRS